MCGLSFGAETTTCDAALSRGTPKLTVVSIRVNDEGDVTVEFTINGETREAKSGDSVWVARGAVHSFRVTSEVCQVLNAHTPGDSNRSSRVSPCRRGGENCRLRHFRRPTNGRYTCSSTLLDL